jgi:hypothetical protein
MEMRKKSSVSGRQNNTLQVCIIITERYLVMQLRVYSAAVVAIDAFEVEIEVHAGRGNTDKAALDSPVNKQQRQGELDNECKRDSTIADANHDDRIDAEHQKKPDLSEGRGFYPSQALWQIDRPAVLKPGLVRTGVLPRKDSCVHPPITPSKSVKSAESSVSIPEFRLKWNGTESLPPGQDISEVPVSMLDGHGGRA